MKKLFILIMCVSALVCCEENVKNHFDSKGAVYFQLNAARWGDARDSVVCSFVGVYEDEQVMNIRVMLMGDAALHDREVKISVNRDLTTATEGVHYRAIQESYTLSKDKFYVNIPITFINSSDLVEKERLLILDLEPSNDLSLGIVDRVRARIIITNMLVKPSNWDTYVSYLGEWSRVKHEKVIELLGINDFENANLTHAIVWNGGDLLSRWFEDNYPVYDENGNIIEPWF